VARLTRRTRNRVTRITTLGLGLLAWGAVAAGPAQAETATSNLSVTATITNNCIISTSDVAFGAYDPIVAHASSALNGTGTVTVTCTSGASAIITLGQASHANPSSTDAVPKRRMHNSGSSKLSYFLYSNAGWTTVWGNTAGTGVAHTGIGTATAMTVYGQVTAGQNVAAGSYSDTVVATVTF
jgi:spore coat protein U-like protein